MPDRLIGGARDRASRSPGEPGAGLMRGYAKLGDVNGVCKAYKVLTESLRREVEDENAEPLPESTALFGKLTRQPASY